MDRERFEQAVRNFWKIRTIQAAKQRESGTVDAGLRGSVTGGAQLDEVIQVVADLFVSAGVPSSSVRRSAGIELPGFYRPTKRWDLIVADHGTLIAAIEFKSHIGPSFGNNFNNRSEEAIGSATDVWRAYQEGTFGPVRPWLAYFLLVEETARSTSPVRLGPSAFPIDPVFEETSYLDRYRILCQRLVRERLYDAACLVATPADPGEDVYEPTSELGFANFAAAVAGRAAYIRALP